MVRLNHWFYRLEVIAVTLPELIGLLKTAELQMGGMSYDVTCMSLQLI